MNKQIMADMMLVFVTVCWGISYLLMDICLCDMGAFTLNMYRFIGAFAVAFILGFPKLKKVSKTTMKYSFFLGIALCVTYIGATYGVMYTSLSNAGFLCALAVIFTPILAFIFKGVVPEKKLAFVVIMCTIGIAILTLDENLSFASGDILCLMCALAYAVQMLITETAVRKEDVNAFHLGVFQLFFTGLFCGILAFLIEEPQLPSNGTVWMSVLFLMIFCTGAAFIIQAIAQQYTSATRVGVIFTLEPVFAGIVAYFLAGEVLLPRAYGGAVLLIFSLLLMEIDLKKFIKKP